MSCTHPEPPRTVTRRRPVRSTLLGPPNCNETFCSLAALCQARVCADVSSGSGEPTVREISSIPSGSHVGRYRIGSRSLTIDGEGDGSADGSGYGLGEPPGA